MLTKEETLLTNAERANDTIIYKFVRLVALLVYFRFEV